MTIRDKTVFCLAVITGSMLGQTPKPQENWKALIGRGVDSFKLGQYGESIGFFQRAVALNSDDPIPHLYLGIALHTQFVPGAQNTTSGDQSVAQYRRALDLDAANWPALVLLGQLERDRGNFDEASGAPGFSVGQAIVPQWPALLPVARQNPNRRAGPGPMGG
jgi:hypothetical protein